MEYADDGQLPPFLIPAAVWAAFVFSGQASGQPIVQPQLMACAPVANATASWLRQYQEQPYVWRGVADGALKGLIEIWAHPMGQAWTLFWRRPDGMLCRITSGSEGYETRPSGQEA